MKDRFTRGFAAGAIAGIPTFVFNSGAFYLQLSTLRWLDFMGIFTYGRAPIGLGETLFTILAVYVFLGFIGILFAYLIPRVSHQHLIFKGWVFGVVIWFVSYAITLLFQVPELAFIPPRTVISNFLGASIWGVSLALALNWLHKRAMAKG